MLRSLSRSRPDFLRLARPTARKQPLQGPTARRARALFNSRHLCSAAHVEDTIFALSSGARGIRSGVAILRVSGPDAKDVLTHLCKPGSVFPKPRVASYRRLYGHTSAADYELLDKALVIWFPAPNTFTGEDVVELHLHGGRSVVSGEKACESEATAFLQSSHQELSKRLSICHLIARVLVRVLGRESCD
jgi:hypothetical protein